MNDLAEDVNKKLIALQYTDPDLKDMFVKQTESSVFAMMQLEDKFNEEQKKRIINITNKITEFFDKLKFSEIIFIIEQVKFAMYSEALLSGAFEKDMDSSIAG